MLFSWLPGEKIVKDCEEFGVVTCRDVTDFSFGINDGFRWEGLYAIVLEELIPFGAVDVDPWKLILCNAGFPSLFGLVAVDADYLQAVLILCIGLFQLCLLYKTDDADE